MSGTAIVDWLEALEVEGERGNTVAWGVDNGQGFSFPLD